MYSSATPVVHEGLLYACTDPGEMQCIDPKTGEKLWAHEEKQGFYSSPVAVGDHIYWTTKKGTMIVTQAGKSYKELGRAKLGEHTSATPAVVNGVMYIRTFTHLMSLGR